MKQINGNINTLRKEMKDLYMVFEKLLYDTDDKVTTEAPGIFRVLGKRRPEFVIPYTELLQKISETDENRVVKIHCLGAIKAIKTDLRSPKGKLICFAMIYFSPAKAMRK